ncbi:MAG: sodium-dependent transporter [Oscillospiraceae bacterium]|nr:sodium-dependent transporter [Oscillospiraceae bacterium]
MNERSSFTGKIGFVLAAAGSAVGLGNIWRFPYLAAKYGGGIFLLMYLILALTFGFALMVGEIALGRKTGQSAIGAFGALSQKHRFIGLLASAVPIIILPYYSVIGGWVMKYLSVMFTGNLGPASIDGYFEAFIAQPMEPIGWFLLFIGLTAAVVLCGVEKGIEKVSKWMMPILVVLTLGIAVYSMFMPGAMDGVLYYITPDFSKFSMTTVLAAMGQLFYSMSLAMGIMITYGSYMKKEVSITSAVKQIEVFDSGVAFLAGMMVIPAVFSFSGGDEAALGKGPGLMFVTLPKVFASIPGIAGSIVGALFFLLVLLAALTSSISLMETVVSIFRDKFGWGRKSTCLFVLMLSIILGLPSSLGFGLWKDFSFAGMTILDMFDFFSNSILMPIVALLTCWFIGYVIGPKTLTDEVEISGKFGRKKLFVIMIRYIALICILLILLTSILDVLGIMKI